MDIKNQHCTRQTPGSSAKKTGTEHDAPDRLTSPIHCEDTAFHQHRGKQAFAVVFVVSDESTLEPGNEDTLLDWGDFYVMAESREEPWGWLARLWRRAATATARSSASSVSISSSGWPSEHTARRRALSCPPIRQIRTSRPTREKRRCASRPGLWQGPRHSTSSAHSRGLAIRSNVSRPAMGCICGEPRACRPSECLQWSLLSALRLGTDKRLIHNQAPCQREFESPCGRQRCRSWVMTYRNWNGPRPTP